eukprot:scaffold1377_cov126-Cylindrotheca_fusiformis.AAC.23
MNNNTNQASNSAAAQGSAPPTSQAPHTQAGNANTPSATATLTITETPPQNQTDEVLQLTLQARPSVTWNEDVVDNEGLGRKSSKRCCIFHKQREFGESSTDSSDSEGSSSSGGPGNGKERKVARKKSGSAKQKKKVPDYQRFHA